MKVVEICDRNICKCISMRKKLDTLKIYKKGYLNPISGFFLL